MFTAQQTSRNAQPPVRDSGALDSRASGNGRGNGNASGLSRRGLDQIYVGKREAGVPTVLVVRHTGAEYLPTPERGSFSWGWPATGGGRRLAHALLLDLTGRNAPPWVVDRLAGRELAQLPRAAFSVTGRQILGWIGSYGYSILDWPQAHVDRSPRARSTAQADRSAHPNAGANRKRPTQHARSGEPGPAVSRRVWRAIARTEMGATVAPWPLPARERREEAPDRA